MGTIAGAVRFIAKTILGGGEVSEFSDTSGNRIIFFLGIGFKMNLRSPPPFGVIRLFVENASHGPRTGGGLRNRHLAVLAL
jgi:hypothetical protein